MKNFLWEIYVTPVCLLMLRRMYAFFFHFHFFSLSVLSFDHKIVNFFLPRTFLSSAESEQSRAEQSRYRENKIEICRKSYRINVINSLPFLSFLLCRFCVNRKRLWEKTTRRTKVFFDISYSYISLNMLKRVTYVDLFMHTRIPYIALHFGKKKL